MEEQQHSIDELFRQSLGDYRETPPPAAWDAIEQRINDAPKRRRYFLRWPWIFCLLLLITGGAAWYITSDNSDKGAKQAVKTNTAKPILPQPAMPVTVRDSLITNHTAPEETAAPKTTGYTGTSTGVPMGRTAVHRKRQHAVSTIASRRHSPVIKQGTSTANEQSDSRKEQQAATTQDVNTSQQDNDANDQITGKTAIAPTSAGGNKTRRSRSGRKSSNQHISAAKKRNYTPDIQTVVAPNKHYTTRQREQAEKSQQNKTTGNAGRKPGTTAGLPAGNGMPGKRIKSGPSRYTQAQKSTSSPAETNSTTTTIQGNTTRPASNISAAGNTRSAVKPNQPAIAKRKALHTEPASSTTPQPVATKPAFARSQHLKHETSSGNSHKPLVSTGAAAGTKKIKTEKTAIAKPLLPESASVAAENTPATETAAQQPGTKEFAPVREKETTAVITPEEEAVQGDKGKSENAETSEADDKEGPGGNGSAQGNTSRRKKKPFNFKLPPASLTALAGYEVAVQKPAPNRGAIALQLLLHINSAFSLGIQPAYKFGNLSSLILQNNQNYFTPGTVLVDSSKVVDSVAGTTKYNYFIRQGYDSIITPSTQVSGRIWELELPVIIHYQPFGSKWHVYGGPSFTFGGKIATTTRGSLQTYTLLKRDSIFLNPNPLPASAFRDYFNLSLRPNSNSYTPQTNEPDAIRLGYTIGFGYEWHNFLGDISLRQQVSGYGNISNDQLRKVYTSPSVRISLGYRIFGTGTMRRPNVDRDFIQRL